MIIITIKAIIIIIIITIIIIRHPTLTFAGLLLQLMLIPRSSQSSSVRRLQELKFHSLFRSCRAVMILCFSTPCRERGGGEKQKGVTLFSKSQIFLCVCGSHGVHS